MASVATARPPAAGTDPGAVDRTGFGHACSLEATARRLAPLLDRVPITRVYDATALDRLGLPVWAAVTPLACDLTVHAGKGVTAEAARISAIMEAIERVCAESIDPGRVVVGSLRDLRRRDEPVLDPRAFDLPFGTAFAPDRECAWVRGHDLLAGRAAWVALDLVLSPAVEGVCAGVETNGLAAGNAVVEATLHGLYELIERDAAAEHRFRRRHGEGAELPPVRVVDGATLPAGPAMVAARLRAAGVALVLEELTHDIGVPVFRALIHDGAFPGREGRTTSFEGLGADLDPAIALTRAITEAAQAHTAVLVGARDSFEGGREPPAGRRRFLDWLAAPAGTRPAPAPVVLPDRLDERLGLVLDRLRHAGFAHCVTVELTRPELGVPVVRVLLPGASYPYGESARRPSLRLLRTLA